MDPLTGEINNHSEDINTSYHRHDTLEAEKFANDFLIFSPDGELPQLVTTGSSTSNSRSSSTLTTPVKQPVQPVVQPIDEPAFQAPIPLPFNLFLGSMALVHHDYAYTAFPFPVPVPIPPLVPAPVSEPALDALSVASITEGLLLSPPPPHPLTPEVWTLAPKKSNAAVRKRKRETTPDDREAPPLACERSHRKRRRTWRHVEGLERLSGTLDLSTLEKVFFSLNTGYTAMGYKLDMGRFGLTKDVFVCGERLRQGCSQRGTSDVLELGDKGLCGMVFLAEQSLRRHLQTALSHVGKRPCQKCGGMYALRKDGYDRHVSK
jgi:hypothetical protein